MVIWDVEQHTQITTLQAEVPDNFFSIDWDNHDERLAVVTGDFVIQVWDINTGAVLYESPPFTSYTAEFSPYGGRLAVSNLSLPAQQVSGEIDSTLTQNNARIFGKGVVQIIVPTPSLERLQSIAEACNTPATIEQSLTASIEADRLTEFVAQVEALPENTIPPACRADLLAVAESIQNR